MSKNVSAAIILLIALVACDSPTAPSAGEITVYELPNFAGAALNITEDIADLGAIPGPCDGSWNNCISSVRITNSDWSVFLWPDPDFTGPRNEELGRTWLLSTKTDLPDFRQNAGPCGGSFDDCVSSIGAAFLRPIGGSPF